jgi:hypothetical protein
LKNKDLNQAINTHSITGDKINAHAVTDVTIGSINASQITSGTINFYTEEIRKNLPFGHAIEFLKEGHKVKRKDWGGYWKLEYWHKAEFEKPELIIVAYLEDTGRYKPATTYQEHILAEDWEVVE